MKVSKKRVYYEFIMISILLLWLQYIISLKFSLIKYYDEIFAILLAITYLCKGRLKIEKRVRDVFFLSGGIALIGLISNFFSSINSNLPSIMIDYWSIVKIYITYNMIISITSSSVAQKILYKMYRPTCFYIIAAFVSLLMGYALKISFFFKDESAARYDLRAYSFIAANAGNFGYLLIAIFSILQFNRKKGLCNKIVKLLTLFLIIMTTKGPQLMFVALWAAFSLLQTNKVKIHHIVLVIMLGLVLGRYQISAYFMNTASARYALMSTALKIARKYFPIGTGFATFGSEMSRKIYSPLYSLYGLNKIYGLSPDYSVYVTDNYWPMVLAQLGVIGLLCVALLLFSIFKDINEIKNRPLIIKWSLLALYITFLIGSLGSAYYNTATGMFCFTVVGLIVKANISPRNERGI